MSTKVKAIIFGVLCFFAIHFANEILAYITAGNSEGMPSEHWYYPVSYWFGLFTWVIPGIVAGYLSREGGVKLGAIVGASAHILLIVPNTISLMGLGFPWAWLTVNLNQALISTFMNAVGGGTGELLAQKRLSNHALERDGKHGVASR